MTTWEEVIEAATFEFVEGLERRGFRVDGRMLAGPVTAASGDVQVRIQLTDDFPFAPPIVFPLGEFPRSWHRERNGSTCLYPVDERADLPWLDVDDFIATMTRWSAESATGWTHDLPDLDLERYFPSADEPLVVYGDLDQLNNRFIQLRHRKYVTRVTGPGSIPTGKSRIDKNRSFGFVTDIGDPSVPPTDWNELKAMIAPTDKAAIEAGVGIGRFTYLVVRYSRGGVGAAVVLRLRREGSSTISVASVKNASEAPETLTLRAPGSAASLAHTRVAVIGVGAIGSFVCDLLARSGVGTISAYDPDIVRPGNLIRHLASADLVGLAKPMAVKHVIEARPFNRSRIVGTPEALPPPSEISILFEGNDLVIDASASGRVTPMLAQMARASGRHMISVCLQADGSVVRVDVIPPLIGEPIPSTDLGPSPSPEDLRYEAGCGDPVSQTPAFAVFEAASLAVRHATGLLLGTPISDNGTLRGYR